MVTVLRLPVSESSTRSQNLIPSTDSEHKFQKIPETVQLLSSPTPITQSSINPNKTKTNQH